MSIIESEMFSPSLPLLNLPQDFFTVLQTFSHIPSPQDTNKRLKPLAVIVAQLFWCTPPQHITVRDGREIAKIIVPQNKCLDAISVKTHQIKEKS